MESATKFIRTGTDTMADMLIRHTGIRPVRDHGSGLFDGGILAATRLLNVETSEDTYPRDNDRGYLMGAKNTSRVYFTEHINLTDYRDSLASTND